MENKYFSTFQKHFVLDGPCTSKQMATLALRQLALGALLLAICTQMFASSIQDSPALLFLSTFPIVLGAWLAFNCIAVLLLAAHIFAREGMQSKIRGHAFVPPMRQNIIRSEPIIMHRKFPAWRGLPQTSAFA